jgi:hypothetical protein
LQGRLNFFQGKRVPIHPRKTPIEWHTSKAKRVPSRFCLGKHQLNGILPRQLKGPLPIGLGKRQLNGILPRQKGFPFQICLGKHQLNGILPRQRKALVNTQIPYVYLLVFFGGLPKSNTRATQCNPM